LHKEDCKIKIGEKEKSAYDMCTKSYLVDGHQNQ